MIVISESTMEHTLTISIIAATTSWLLFLVAYSVTAKWWKHALGRNTFGVSLVLFMILFRLMVLRIWPDIEQKALVGIFVYVLAGVFAFRRMWLMLTAQLGKGKPPTPAPRKGISRVH